MDVEVNDNDAWGALQKSLILAFDSRTTSMYRRSDQSIDCVTIWPGFVPPSHLKWAFRDENWRFNDEFVERSDFGDVLIYDARFN